MSHTTSPLIVSVRATLAAVERHNHPKTGPDLECKRMYLFLGQRMARVMAILDNTAAQLAAERQDAWKAGADATAVLLALVDTDDSVLAAAHALSGLTVTPTIGDVVDAR